MKKTLFIILIFIIILFFSEFFLNKCEKNEQFSIEKSYKELSKLKNKTAYLKRSLYIRDTLPKIIDNKYIMPDNAGYLNDKIPFIILDIQKLKIAIPEIWLKIKPLEGFTDTTWVIGYYKNEITIRPVNKTDFQSLWKLLLRFFIVSSFTAFIFLLLIHLNNNNENQSIELSCFQKWNLKINFLNIMKFFFVLISYFLILLYANHLYIISPDAFKSTNIVLLIFDWAVRENNFLLISFISGLIYYKLLKN